MLYSKSIVWEQTEPQFDPFDRELVCAEQSSRSDDPTFRLRWTSPPCQTKMQYLPTLKVSKLLLLSFAGQVTGRRHYLIAIRCRLTMRLTQHECACTASLTSQSTPSALTFWHTGQEKRWFCHLHLLVSTPYRVLGSLISTGAFHNGRDQSLCNCRSYVYSTLLQPTTGVI